MRSFFRSTDKNEWTAYSYNPTEAEKELITKTPRTEQELLEIQAMYRRGETQPTPEELQKLEASWDVLLLRNNLTIEDLNIQGVHVVIQDGKLRGVLNAITDTGFQQFLF
tara:strand:- start:205 stop:534 length:330 start_codon:yes stop_codon:yes gene_type:complete